MAALKKSAPAVLTARQLRAISRVLADPQRFEILKQIAAEPCKACSDLRSALPITAPTLSHHLKELESAGLIEIQRRGKFAELTFCRDTWNAYVKALSRL